MILFCTGHRVGEILSFEEWYDGNEDEVFIHLAETGADRELDYDAESEVDTLYEFYVNSYIDSAIINEFSGEIYQTLIDDGRKKLAEKLIHTEIQEVKVYDDKVSSYIFAYDKVRDFRSFVCSGMLIEIAFNKHKRPIKLLAVKLK